MRKKQFKTESKKVLDMMIHSIYTHKEIFLRELISNASDALDKLSFNLLTNKELKLNKADLKIEIATNKHERELIISDNGIGMTREELEKNLGIIAKSGSLEFKNELADNHDAIDIIGQFGVGFYSAFMVASKVVVDTKSITGEASTFTSEGIDGYTITNSDKKQIGTTITLSLRLNDEEATYDEYLETHKLKSLVKKYSDFVRYPIEMEVTNTKYDKDGNTSEIVEVEVLNSMVPLWKKDKSSISESAYNEFYKNEFNDYNDPFKVIHSSVEGSVSYKSLLFIPKEAPFDFYQLNYKSSVKLYTKGVFIMDDYDKLIPEHFKFIKGVVDTDDISLNISRELLQNNRQLIAIKKHLEKKIKKELSDLLANDRSAYEQFYNSFGLQLKLGCYNDFGAHKEVLQDLLLFKSSKQDEYTTLLEYVNNMDDTQEFIYYISGDSIDKIKSMPQMEKLANKGYAVLYLLDDVDEFLLQVLGSYNEKQFKSLNQGELDLATNEEKTQLEAQEKSDQELLDKIKASLENEVSEVRLTSRLVSYPACLVSGEGVSFEMEKVLAHTQNSLSANKILELNPEHALYDKFKQLDDAQITKYAKLLYGQALLIEGFTIENPVEFSELLNELMIQN